MDVAAGRGADQCQAKQYRHGNPGDKHESHASKVSKSRASRSYYSTVLVSKPELRCKAFGIKILKGAVQTHSAQESNHTVQH